MQKESRNESNVKLLSEEEKEKKISQIIKDMAIMGTIVKEQIIEEKKLKPEKFVSIEEVVKPENKDRNDSPLFIIGILAQNLENQGVTTAIEKESSNDDGFATTSLQIMLNGMVT